MLVTPSLNSRSARDPQPIVVARATESTRVQPPHPGPALQTLLLGTGWDVTDLLEQPAVAIWIAEGSI